MHIDPELITGAKVALGYVTGSASLLVIAKQALSHLKSPTKSLALAASSIITTALVLFFFQVLPHPPVGLSEVHFIFGSMLFLMFGMTATGIGLAAGLLLQGLFFAPFDLPQYGMNITTLLVPLMAMNMISQKIIPQGTSYVDLSYAQVLKLSSVFQAGIVAWVAFWAFYGQGFTAETLTGVSTFGIVYLSVIIIEPVIDLAALYTVKNIFKNKNLIIFNSRLV